MFTKVLAAIPYPAGPNAPSASARSRGTPRPYGCERPKCRCRDIGGRCSSSHESRLPFVSESVACWLQKLLMEYMTPMGTDSTKARMPCQRLPGCTRSVIAKPSVARTRDGTTTSEMTPGKFSRPRICVQRPKKSIPISRTFAHARTREVVSIFIGFSLFLAFLPAPPLDIERPSVTLISPQLVVGWMLACFTRSAVHTVLKTLIVRNLAA
jgi:hypothetical protein